jgi:hypothetical protein
LNPVALRASVVALELKLKELEEMHEGKDKHILSALNDGAVIYGTWLREAQRFERLARQLMMLCRNDTDQ